MTLVSPHAPSPRNSSGKFRRARGVRDGCSSQSRVGSGAQRQAQRPGPRFRDLKSAFDAKRVELGRELPDETAPSMVVVLDLVDGVTDFQNAVNRIEGFEFLSEWVDEETNPDDDFHRLAPHRGPEDHIQETGLAAVAIGSELVGEHAHLDMSRDPGTLPVWGRRACFAHDSPRY